MARPIKGFVSASPYHVPWVGFFIACLHVLCWCGQSAVIDAWRAADLAMLDDGDGVGAWTSVGGRILTAATADTPRFIKDATPTGESAVRFEFDRLTTPSSPVAERAEFSLVVVFKVTSPGVDEGSGWSTKSGIVDANQVGSANDWGFAVRDTGFVTFGTGAASQSDRSVYLDDQPTYPSVVDGKYHVVVCTWGSGTQTMYMDNLPAKSQGGVSTTLRANAGLSFGAVHSGEANRRFDGEIAEVQFHDKSLRPAEAAALISELTYRYITKPRPEILFFTLNTNRVYAGESVTLSWSVSNAASVSIDNGIGAGLPLTGTAIHQPDASTTYTLTASNAVGLRSATTTVIVDPGIPVAYHQTVSAIRNTPRAIVLSGQDPQGESLHYSLRQLPEHGEIQGQTPNLIYMPDAGFTGTDVFTFVVGDGANESVPASVQIYVDPDALAPHAIFVSAPVLNAKAAPGALLVSFRAVDANRFDKHSFSLLPGLDTNLFVLEGSRLIAGPGFPVNAGSRFNIPIRATDSAGLTCERTFSLTAVALGGALVINEVHHNPSDNTLREEFVELHNPGEAAIDVSSWRLRGGIDFVFPSGTSVEAGGFLVVASDPATINARYGISAIGPWSGNLSSEGERVVLRDALGQVIDEVDYKSEFPWPIAAGGNGPSMELLNPTLDNDLGSSWKSPVGEGARPSPGLRNRVFTENAAPNIRQVQHSPKQPTSTNQVLVTARVTDPQGVAGVRLTYQVIAPGKFIASYLPLSVPQLNAVPNTVQPANPEFEAEENWISVEMRDDGFDGDAEAGDDVYSVMLAMRPNRTLIRYRITCSDVLGASRRAPFEDDPSLNFAYFVYDGVPAYGGVSSTDLQSLPIYFLITRDEDFQACAAYDGRYQLPQFTGSIANEGRFVFNWPGAFVYDGEVYDHVRYRLRGANGRYQNGKRNFRLRFNDGRFLEAKDDLGRPYPRKWSKLNTAKGQSNRETLTFALNEYVNYLLLNKVGVPSPHSHYFHWRVVRSPQEAADPYNGDFYGVSWAQEDYDSAFLETHGLPKGNLYKLINAVRDPDPYRDMVEQQRYQGAFAVTNGADAVRIQNALLNPNATQTDAWLLANVNYTNWFRYHAVLEAVRNYDTWPSANKNAAWFFDTDYNSANQFMGRFWTLPWDWTDSWGPTWNAGQDLAWNGAFGSTAALHPNLRREYRNVVRELRDLLFQPDQINPLIDAVAARLAPVAPADLQRWRNSTPWNSAYASLGNPGPALSQGLAGYVQDMKNFMFVGGSKPWWIDRQSIGAGGWSTRLDALANDPTAPTRPSITYAGPTGFPLNQLTFASSQFADPGEDSAFAAMEWRVAEVLDPNAPVGDPRLIPPMEWDATWQSGPISNWVSELRLPGTYLTAGRVYRARVRHLNQVGTWSRWSAPVEFRPSNADVTNTLRDGLRLTEIMYHPPALGIFDSDDLEFIELKNIANEGLGLGGVRIEGAITFVFTNGSSLGPGEFLVLGRNAEAFREKYASGELAGLYSGKLDNAGETIRMATASGAPLMEVTYDDTSPWPIAADGGGPSLVPAPGQLPAWRASTTVGGSPGLDDPPFPAEDSDGDGLPDDWEAANGIDPHKTDADSDPDEDKFTNLQEWMAGTDPQDPRSLLKLNGEILDGGLLLKFDAVAGRSYSLLGTDGSGGWATLVNVRASTNGVIEIQQSIETNRWYRLRSP